MRSDDPLALSETRAWIERAVIGLHLCPFAATPQSRGQVRYAVSEARDVEALLQALVAELDHLVAEPPERVETTLLVHPHVLADFLDYNDFLDLAEAAIAARGLEGVVQIASFHPQYCFAGIAPDDVANATNRSPFPMLQLLREASVERALAGIARPEAIFEANITTLRRLGSAGWEALQRQWQADARAAGNLDPAAPR